MLVLVLVEVDEVVLVVDDVVDEVVELEVLLEVVVDVVVEVVVGGVVVVGGGVVGVAHAGGMSGGAGSTGCQAAEWSEAVPFGARSAVEDVQRRNTATSGCCPAPRDLRERDLEPSGAHAGP